MAKPKKKGLDYYYKSVHDMDDFRVMDLMEKYGSDGYVVLDMTMSCIYRNGYYLEMPIQRLGLYIYRYIAGSTSKTSDDVAEIIMYCGEIGLFDRELLRRSVITSVEIQEHYACVVARRKADKSKYWLLPNPSAEPCEETEARQSAEKTGVFAAKTGIYAAETRVSDANCGRNAAVIPQSKEKQSKANESKVNETKPNESKAKQTKAKQNARVSADEIFCVPESAGYPYEPADAYTDAYDAAAAGSGYEFADAYTDAYNAAAAGSGYDPADAYTDAYDAAAGSGYEPADAYTDAYDAAAGSGYEFADAYTDAGTAYGTIENAYMTVSGKKLNDTDRADIALMRREGADDGLIIQAMNQVAARRKKQKINSFRYFMPMIRDILQKTEKRPDSACGKQMSCDDGFIHSDTAYEDPYADCVTTEDYLAVMDRESKAVPKW